MPTGREIVSGLESIVQRFKLSQDVNVSRPHLFHLLAIKRAKQIEEYTRELGAAIDPSWVQRMGVVKVTKTSRVDDPEVPDSCESIGRVSIPSVVRLYDDKGVYRVATPGQVRQYSRIPFEQFMNMDSSVEQFNYDLWWREETNVLKIHPFTEELNLYLILHNPFDGYVIKTDWVKSGDLIVEDDYVMAESYEVFEGLVTHDGVDYLPGQIFEASKSTFTGPGKVKLKDRKRKLNLDDPYPIDGATLNTITMRIMIEDFRLSKEQVLDLQNDKTNATTPEGGPGGN